MMARSDFLRATAALGAGDAPLGAAPTNASAATAAKMREQRTSDRPPLSAV